MGQQADAENSTLQWQPNSTTGDADPARTRGPNAPQRQCAGAAAATARTTVWLLLPSLGQLPSTSKKHTRSHRAPRTSAGEDAAGGKVKQRGRGGEQSRHSSEIKHGAPVEPGNATSGNVPRRSETRDSHRYVHPMFTAAERGSNPSVSVQMNGHTKCHQGATCTRNEILSSLQGSKLRHALQRGRARRTSR